MDRHIFIGHLSFLLDWSSNASKRLHVPSVIRFILSSHEVAQPSIDVILRTAISPTRYIYVTCHSHCQCSSVNPNMWDNIVSFSCTERIINHHWHCLAEVLEKAVISQTAAIRAGTV
jgi:hypothetical protein